MYLRGRRVVKKKKKKKRLHETDKNDSDETGWRTALFIFICICIYLVSDRYTASASYYADDINNNKTRRFKYNALFSSTPPSSAFFLPFV